MAVAREATGKRDMKTDELLEQFQDAAIVAAIVAAEARTTGEIRVFITRKAPDDAVARAERRFRKLGMHRTEQRNGVLLYLAPRVQKFAVVGDEGIHRQCGQDFWETVAAGLSSRLRTGRYTDAVVHAVTEIGEILARHFPGSRTDNELPDEIVRD